MYFNETSNEYRAFRLSACSSTVSNNLTYIQNPSYPTAYTTTTECKYTIKPLSSDICQIR